MGAVLNGIQFWFRFRWPWVTLTRVSRLPLRHPKHPKQVEYLKNGAF